MGSHPNITAASFPLQSDTVGRKAKVCFNYDTKTVLVGTVVRDDREEPFETIIHLADGRHVRAVECQYMPDPAPGPSALDRLDPDARREIESIAQGVAEAIEQAVARRGEG